MTAESTLFGWLAEDDTLTALVGGEDDPRIYPDVVPADKPLPAIAYARTGTEPIATIHGTVLGNFVTMQIQAWAATRVLTESVADAIVGALIAVGEVPISRAVLFDTDTGFFGTSIDVRLLVD